MLLEYKVCDKDIGKSVKQIINEHYSLSARTISKLKASGGIKVNGNAVTVRYALRDEDILTLELLDEENKNIEKTDIPLDVLYEDNDILVVNKPFGMPIHPSQGHHNDTLANAVAFRYKDESFTFRAITRLDGDTTGVTLVARNALSAQRLTDSLQNGQIKKEYNAVVCGIPVHERGVIDAPISRCEDSIIKRKISPDGKSSVTEYEVISQSPDGRYSLIKAIPITGRTHQIRLHLSHIGHPLYGDFLYGTPIDNVRAYLHCSRLTFPHPMTKEILTISAPLPEDMKSIMKA